MVLVKGHLLEEKLCNTISTYTRKTCLFFRISLYCGKQISSAAAQVVYPVEGNVSIAVTVTAGRIPALASVAYVLSPLTATVDPFLAGLAGSVSGVLAWDPVDGGQTSVPVPIDWSQVCHRVCNDSNVVQSLSHLLSAPMFCLVDLISLSSAVIFFFAAMQSALRFAARSMSANCAWRRAKVAANIIQ